MTMAFRFDLQGFAVFSCFSLVLVFGSKFLLAGHDQIHQKSKDIIIIIYVNKNSLPM